jgi:hypothetical protein
METVITLFVDRVILPVTSVIPTIVDGGLAFIIFAAMWIGFAFAVFTDPGKLDDAWLWVRSLNIVAQLLLWLLFLPVLAAVWIWETAWPMLVRVTFVGGLALWSLWMFIPKALTAAKP